VLDGEPRYRVDQVWDGLYRRAAAIDELTDLPAALRARLAERLPASLSEVTRSASDGGDTVKWLWSLRDGNRIETVLMHYDRRSTVCVSTQAGCAMACDFCATGQAGFARNLSTGEILEQVARARRDAAPRRVDNVVFMGMGEPMANFDRTWEAVERLHDDMGLSARALTISTVGIVPGIRRMTALELPVNLAVSLHAADDELRDRLVPINRRYPLDDLLAACEDYVRTRRRRLSFEWALIDGVNDRHEDAERLAVLAHRVRAHVNLIPLNPTDGFATRGTPPERVAGFRDHLRSIGVNATVRANRGTDIDAACGQLRATVDRHAAEDPSRGGTPVAPPTRRP
jgi:23S rRNA (adenine2503-C2)-methyltransferase